jgi:hypothetical protein
MFTNRIRTQELHVKHKISEVLTVANILTIVFWVVTPCDFVNLEDGK